MREDPLGQDSIFDGVRHFGGNKQQVGGGEGGREVGRNARVIM